MRKFTLSRLAASVGSAIHDRLYAYMGRAGLMSHLVVDNAFETKGTHLYFVDSNGAIAKLTCPTGITGIGGGMGRERVETSTNCSACGKETTVPFRPTQGRPVFCRECFQSRKFAGAGGV
jgi:CxxC-x17-CxxC domain-containing protein